MRFAVAAFRFSKCFRLTVLMLLWKGGYCGRCCPWYCHSLSTTSSIGSQKVITVIVGKVAFVADSRMRRTEALELVTFVTLSSKCTPSLFGVQEWPVWSLEPAADRFSSSNSTSTQQQHQQQQQQQQQQQHYPVRPYKALQGNIRSSKAS